MSELSAAQLDAIEDAVRAVVTRDEERLATIGRDAHDLYVWTRDYGEYGSVDLVMPPEAVSRWPIETTEVVGARRLHVVVPMWTRQEGASDLSLELELHEPRPGEWLASIANLHVP